MANPGKSGWTAKKDKAPRGLLRLGKGWSIRYQCGQHHTHQESGFRYQQDALDALHARRKSRREHVEWCPRVERDRQEAAARLERERHEGRLTVTQFAGVYLADWRQRPRSRTIRQTECETAVLVKAWGQRRVDEIHREDIQALVAKLKAAGPMGRPLGPAALNRYLARVSSFFSLALDRKVITAHPGLKFPQFEVPQERLIYIGLEDRKEEDALRGGLPPELRPLLDVALDTGLRWSEQMALRWCDLDLGADTITVPRSKGGRGRIVPMTTRVKSLLMDLWLGPGVTAAPEDLVFRSPTKQPKDFFDRALARAREALRREGHNPVRLNGFTWHCLRHSYASRLALRGVNLYVIQRLLGHSTPKMTMKYAHLSPDYLKAAVAVLEGRELREEGRANLSGT